MYVDTTNNLLTGEVIDLSSASNLRLDCTFLSGFTGSAHCTVQYGTDPTYMNLPYSAESTETGTVGDRVSVVLRERLNSSRVYYYTVSAVSGDVTVTVRGNFTTPQYSKCWYQAYNVAVTKVVMHKKIAPVEGAYSLQDESPVHRQSSRYVTSSQEVYIHVIFIYNTQIAL